MKKIFKKGKYHTSNELTMIQNNTNYNLTLNSLINIAVSTFKWDNMPETIDLRFLEMTLLKQGACVFFKDPDIGYLVLPVLLDGHFNVYDIPDKRTAFATNGYRYELTPENSVIIFNNYTHTPIITDLTVYALRLFQINQTIDININGQKTPVLIKCNQNQKLSMENLYMQYSGGMPLIYADKNLDPNGLSVLKLDIPFLALNLQAAKNAIWNEALNFLGIPTLEEKRERRINQEVMQQQGGVYGNRFGRLAPRQMAVEQINKMFGLDITCEFRDDMIKDFLRAQEEVKQETNGNGGGKEDE